MGLAYFYWKGRRDPLKMQVIAEAPVTSARPLPSGRRAFALGVVLYCLYVFKVGGDYLAGPFLSFPFVVAALLVADWLQSLKVPRAAVWTALATTAALAMAAAYLWLVPATPLLTPWTYGRDLNNIPPLLSISEDGRITGALDARATSYCTTLAAWWRNGPRLCPDRRSLPPRVRPCRNRDEKDAVCGAVGKTGYYAGLNPSYC